MAEFKTVDDMQYRANYLLQSLCTKLDIRLNEENNRVFIDFDRTTAKWLAAELLDVYTNGVNSWIENQGRKS